jgi:acylphosphatase
MTSVRFLISGRVQGVCFRAATGQRARELGLTGYAKNLLNGCVEVVASGTPQALAELHAWLHEGPPAARVDAVERTDLPAQDHADFTTH